jgi:hypothetical protein
MLALLLSLAPLGPQTASSEPLPVREVSVFKDGHAFVLREGVRRANERGEVVLDGLPEPVLGTFWPYASGGAKLLAATAARERVVEERSALDLAELVRANVGAQVVLIDMENTPVRGKLLGLTERPAEELERLEPEGSGPMLTQFGGLVRLQGEDGSLRALPLKRVRELRVQGELRPRFRAERLVERLTLRTDRAGGDTNVGLAYLQSGLRWIPAYRIELLAGGKAAVRLEATLVNDLVDLTGTTVHLVVGAPRFDFAGEVDPIALAATVAAVSAAAPRQDLFSNRLSNTLMTQVSAFSPEGAADVGAAPTLLAEGAHEDLFLYTVRDVTLARGERLVLPLAEFELPYQDVYVLELVLAPPPEVRMQYAGQQELELARLLGAPKAIHTLRLENTHTAPLTTAPALVLRDGKPLAQGRTSYTPSGARCDLAINPAVGVQVAVDDREANRTEDTWLGDRYVRVGLAGTLTLTNTKREAVTLEVRRDVLGLLDSVGQGGEQRQRSWQEFASSPDMPAWWSWYGWESWWYRRNGLGRASWRLTLEPGASTKLEAAWHYFWR